MYMSSYVYKMRKQKFDRKCIFKYDYPWIIFDFSFEICYILYHIFQLRKSINVTMLLNTIFIDNVTFTVKMYDIDNCQVWYIKK